MVSPAKGICHCFVCGKGGNGIHFIMEHEHVNFYEACKIIANKFNIEFEEKDPTPEELAEQQKKESMQVIYSRVQEFYVKCLHEDTPEAKAMMAYAKHRWSEEAIEERGLGYAPKGNKRFFDFIKSTGLSWELCKEAGLIAESDDRSEYAFFRDRLMIPVRDR